MIEILGLIGILWAVSGAMQGMPDLSDLRGREDDGDEEPAQQSLGDEDDLVADDAYWEGIEALIDEVESGQTLTPDAAERLQEAALRTTGALDIDTGGGADTVLGSDADDAIASGTGDDVVFGGAGDDRVNLGDGDDSYGGSDGVVPGIEDDRLEAGDDTVRGGAGDDRIVDGYGSNLLQGWQGDDSLSALDRDGYSPDTLEGGIGSDTLVADRGDTVSTGTGLDTVTIVLPGAPGGQTVPVTLLDFERGTDVLELELPEGTGPEAVALRDDGADAVLSVLGRDEVRVIGGAGLTLQDVSLLG